jgi:hypothetical protein
MFDEILLKNNNFGAADRITIHEKINSFDFKILINIRTNKSNPGSKLDFKTLSEEFSLAHNINSI